MIPCDAEAPFVGNRWTEIDWNNEQLRVEIRFVTDIRIHQVFMARFSRLFSTVVPEIRTHRVVLRLRSFRDRQSRTVQV